MKTGNERSALLVAVEAEHAYRRVRFNTNTLAPAASTNGFVQDHPAWSMEIHKTAPDKLLVSI